MEQKEMKSVLRMEIRIGKRFENRMENRIEIRMEIPIRSDPLRIAVQSAVTSFFNPSNWINTHC